MKTGVIIKSTGSWYLIRDAEHKVHHGRIIGKFRLKNYKLTNPIAVGDYVDFVLEEEDKALIKQIHSRRNYVVRQSPRKKHFMHLLAANIDHAVLITTIIEPNLKQSFIDRFLMMTEPHDIPVTIVFNKADLYQEKEMNYFKELEEIYTKIGYNVLLISATSKSNLETLRSLIQDKTTLVCGQSGVGKSSTINELVGEEVSFTDDISFSSGKGQHTTTFAEMYDIDSSTHIIDTPGLKQLAFNNYDVMDIAHNFKEFFHYSSDCKYSDCTHRNEPKCAVKDAYEAGEISELRYINYLTLIQESEDQNYWERLSDM